MKCERDLSKKKKIKIMNSKMTTNSRLSTTEPKTKAKQPKQTNRTETEPEKWRSQRGLSAGRGKGRTGKKVQGIRSINRWVQNRQGEAKNSIGNKEAKEPICMIHGHELRWGIMLKGMGIPGRGG